MSQPSESERASLELARRLIEQPDKIPEALASSGKLGVPLAATDSRVLVAAAYHVAAAKIANGELGQDRADRWLQDTLARAGLG